MGAVPRRPARNSQDAWSVGRLGSRIAFWLVATGLALYTLLFAAALGFRPELTPGLATGIISYFMALAVCGFALNGLWKQAYGVLRSRPSLAASSPSLSPAPAAAPGGARGRRP